MSNKADHSLGGCYEAVCVARSVRVWAPLLATVDGGVRGSGNPMSWGGELGSQLWVVAVEGKGSGVGLRPMGFWVTRP